MVDPRSEIRPVWFQASHLTLILCCLKTTSSHSLCLSNSHYIGWSYSCGRFLLLKIFATVHSRTPILRGISFKLYSRFSKSVRYKNSQGFFSHLCLGYHVLTQYSNTFANAITQAVHHCSSRPRQLNKRKITQLLNDL